MMIGANRSPGLRVLVGALAMAMSCATAGKGVDVMTPAER